MEKKIRKIDFILHEDGHEKLIFRFYPRQSHCHSFGDEPPKSWKGVYKVYYSYAIIRHYKYENAGSDILFRSDCDECSAIDEVAMYCDLVSSGITKVARVVNGEETMIDLLGEEIRPSGMGVFWKIIDTGAFRRDNDDPMYLFELFDWDDVGFRFYLYKSELAAFGNYLKECCEYMLAHGEPI